MSEEIKRAIDFANRILDEAYRDPDDDLMVLARQFLRANELRDPVERVIKICVQEGVNRIVESALRLIEGDPHTYGTRPCATCKAVSNIVKFPFGCEKKRENKSQ